VTPQSTPTPPAAPSPGVGTPGTAETGTGPREPFVSVGDDGSTGWEWDCGDLYVYVTRYPDGRMELLVRAGWGEVRTEVEHSWPSSERDGVHAPRQGRAMTDSTNYTDTGYRQPNTCPPPIRYEPGIRPTPPLATQPDTEITLLRGMLADREAKWAAEIERLRVRIGALEGENAALSAALTKRTHEFEQGPADDPLIVCRYGRCTEDSAHPVHRTPARMRAELEER